MDEDQHDELIARVQQTTAAGCERWLRHEASRRFVEAARRVVFDLLWPSIEPLISGDQSWPTAFALATCAGVTMGDVSIGWPSVARADGTTGRPVETWLETLEAHDPLRRRPRSRSG